MTLREWKNLAIWFDGIISGWKRFIALILVFCAMYVLPEGTAQHVVAAFGLFLGSAGFVAKAVNK